VAGEIEIVALDAGASPGTAAAVELVFARAGFEVKAEPFKVRAGPFPVLAVETGAGVTLAAFLRAFAAEAGEDPYATVKAWAREIFAIFAAVDPDHDRAIRIEDSEGTILILTTYNGKSIDALAEIDWEEACGKYLTWDPAAQRWQLS
jgi:hypothetical protein